MPMPNDSNPSVDALLAGFGSLSPEEQIVFLGKLNREKAEPLIAVRGYNPRLVDRTTTNL